jgi:signal peptidase II
MARRYIPALSLAALIVAGDQCAKLAVLQGIPLHRSITVGEGFFNLVHVHNRGAAFGFLNRSDIEWQFWFFAAFTLAAVMLVLYMIRSSRAGFLASSAFGAILGGALGNFIDRARFRHVIDFLDFHLGDLHWPAFNVADIAICYGVGIFVLQTFFSGKKPGRDKTA